MYRAIRRIRGGETIEMQHTSSVEDAWRWLQPGPSEREIDTWFVLPLDIVERKFIDNSVIDFFQVGSNSRVSQQVDIFIQVVRTKQEPLPFSPYPNLIKID